MGLSGGGRGKIKVVRLIGGFAMVWCFVQIHNLSIFCSLNGREICCLSKFYCECMIVCMCLLCVSVCVCACVRVCVRACVHVCIYMFMIMHVFFSSVQEPLLVVIV